MYIFEKLLLNFNFEVKDFRTFHKQHSWIGWIKINVRKATLTFLSFS